MQITPDKRLFWFFKEGVKLDLSEPSQLDMYVQQVITYGSAEDVKTLLRDVGLTQFKEAFIRLKHFIPFEVRKFWEDFIGDN